MTPTLVSVPLDVLTGSVSEIRDLATELGWDGVEKLATTLIDSSAQATIVVATGPGIDVSSWRSRWARSLEDRMEARALTEWMIYPAEAWACSKLLVILSCDRLVDAALRDAVGEMTAGRPTDSWTLVYAGAEKLEDEADLEILERGVRQLSETAHPHLVVSDQESPVSDFLVARLTEDRRRLDDWLVARPADRQPMASWRLSRLLETAEAKARSLPAPIVVEVDQQALELTRRSLRRYRRRLAERLETDFRQLRDEVDLALDQLDRRLSAHLTTELEELLTRAPIGGDTVGLESVVAELLSAEVTHFAEECAIRVETRRRELLEDGRQLLRGIDWRLVESAGRYPDAILAPLTASSLKLAAEPTTDPSPGWATPLSAPNHLATVALATSGGVLSAWVSTFLGLAPLLIALTSASGALGAGWLHMLRNRGLRRRLAVEAVVRQVRPILSQLRDEIRGAVHDLRRQIEAELASRWRELEERLQNAARGVAADPLEGADSGHSPAAFAQERLADIRQRAFPSHHSSHNCL